jgi:Lecithin:cholesterol acyltransferase
MGNKLFHYFCQRVLAGTVAGIPNGTGQQWLNEHVHSFVAIGAPWLGAPKAIRALISGESFGLDAFLDPELLAAWGETLGSSLSLIPYAGNCERSRSLLTRSMFGNDELGFVFSKARGSEEQPALIPFENFLRDKVNADHRMDMFYRYFGHDPCFGTTVDEEEAGVLRPLPVKRLVSVYGVNLKTPVALSYEMPRNSETPKFGSRPPNFPTSYSFKDGTVFETRRTRQPTLVDQEVVTRSGDGTVPYASLAYCHQWKRSFDYDHFQVDELDGVEHREILASTELFRIVIQAVSDRPADETESNPPARVRRGSSRTS